MCAHHAALSGRGQPSQSMTMESVETEGNSIDEAIERALQPPGVHTRQGRHRDHSPTATRGLVGSRRRAGVRATSASPIGTGRQRREVASPGTSHPAPARPARHRHRGTAGRGGCICAAAGYRGAADRRARRAADRGAPRQCDRRLAAPHFDTARRPAGSGPTPGATRRREHRARTCVPRDRASKAAARGVEVAGRRRSASGDLPAQLERAPDRRRGQTLGRAEHGSTAPGARRRDGERLAVDLA